MRFCSGNGIFVPIMGFLFRYVLFGLLLLTDGRLGMGTAILITVFLMAAVNLTLAHWEEESYWFFLPQKWWGYLYVVILCCGLLAVSLRGDKKLADHPQWALYKQAVIENYWRLGWIREIPPPRNMPSAPQVASAPPVTPAPSAAPAPQPPVPVAAPAIAPPLPILPPAPQPPPAAARSTDHPPARSPAPPPAVARNPVPSAAAAPPPAPATLIAPTPEGSAPTNVPPPDPSIVRLNDPGADITATLKQLAGNQQIKAVDLSGSAVKDADLALLDALPDLQALSLDDTAITDRGMEHLTNLRRLRTLWLSGTKVSDRGLATLSGMYGLTELRLNRTAVTDAGTDAVARLTDLQVLHLDETTLGLQGMQRLMALEKLKTLSAAGTKVTPVLADRFEEKVSGAKVLLVPEVQASLAVPQSAEATTSATATAAAAVPATHSIAHAESKMRSLSVHLRMHASRNGHMYPPRLDAVLSAFVQGDDLVDGWGEPYLYFGGGLRYDPFRRTKAIMLATASPREGIHLVLYEDGGIRRMPAEEFARLRAGAAR